MQKEERQKIEEKKKTEYGTYNIFENRSLTAKGSEDNQYNNEEKSEKTSLIEVKKENVFIRILKKIKLFFKEI